MSIKKILKEYEKSAKAAGKPLKIEPSRHGIRIVCEGRYLTIPYGARPTRNIKAMRNALGLN